MGEKNGKLSHRQKKFIVEYQKDFVAKHAAMRAGYAETTAEKVCPLWVGPYRESCPQKFRYIWDHAKKIIGKNLEKNEITVDRVLKELADMGFEDRKILTKEKIPIVNKMKALELIGKHLKMYTEKHEVGGTDGKPINPVINVNTKS